MRLDPKSDYPLGTKRPELIATPGGASLDEIDLAHLRAGVIAGEDIRATAETLLLQAELAERSGQLQLAESLRRASELTLVPEDVILAIYTALRPGRSSAAVLDDWAETLEDEFDAPSTAAFVREAAKTYLERGLTT